MSTSFESVKQLKHWLAYTFLAVPLCIAPAFAEEPKSAAIMPKANKSLLIDVEKAGNNLVAVGERGHVLISSDNGKTWAQSNVPMAQMINGVSFPDNRHGWAVGHDGHIIRTEDGGVTWTKQRDGLGAQAEANVRKLRSVKTQINRLNAELIDTSITPEKRREIQDALSELDWDLESATERVNEPAVAQPLMDVWFENAKNGWVVGAFGQLLHTTDGGDTWEDLSGAIDNEMEFHLNSVTGIDGGTVVVAGEAGFVVVTPDDGKTWYSIDLGYEGTIFGVKADHTGSTIVATGLRGKTFISKDKGLNWADITPDVGFSLSGVEFIDDDSILLVGHGGTISFSADAGNNFNTETLPSRASISNAVYTGNGEFILVGQGGVHTYTLKPSSEEK
ncbi:Ycf48-like protein [BD1-7 clade bacterium]|uniref:Ycf48-like protein n=1 Tax=BD1-7 clade bacterium TaxID=2029982 RepID=A0A5S9NSF2_9GAMM|nr:Ycf48-like protein [BD1-7 clade bacterium]CAA0093357.1 Ycf48-like protein [BD1-7 clade bacterium]